MITKIQFKYGSMNSGKSLELIKIAYNFKENNIDTLILKPKIDTRKANKVFSRANLEVDAVEISESDHEDTLKKIVDKIGNAKVIMVDESNFLSEKSVDAIIDYAYEHKLNAVMFFGLKVDFRGNLFEGTKRIIERADKIEESTSICWCGKKARQNARVVNNKIIKTGETVVIDDDADKVTYISLCNYHYYKEELS